MSNLTQEQLQEALTSEGRNVFMTDEMKDLIDEMVVDGKKVKDIAAAINEDPRFEIAKPKQTYNRVFNYLKRRLERLSKN